MNYFTKLYKQIVVLTGAGVSVASGIPPFRGEGGLWEDPENAKYSSADALRQESELAWNFWMGMREKCESAAPNSAHLALADWENSLASDQSFTLITQNVDRLHQRAGSKNVIELHGSIFRLRCTEASCNFVQSSTISTNPDHPLETCSETSLCEKCGSSLRPDLVLFDEPLPAEAEWNAKRALRNCDLFIAIGTSGTVSPASRFVDAAKYAEARTILVNREPMNPNNPAFDRQILGLAEEIVPAMQCEFFLSQKMLDDRLPPADPEREEDARKMFDTSGSPEEQAARRGHLELFDSYDNYRYTDKVLDKWIHYYYQVIRSPHYLHQCRQKHLTVDELAEVEDDDGT